jgi:hypothetical protein
MKPCRSCKHEISEQAMACPHCGAPFPAKDKFDGWGFECAPFVRSIAQLLAMFE